jgi:hypothetical protein
MAETAPIFYGLIDREAERLLNNIKLAAGLHVILKHPFPRPRNYWTHTERPTIGRIKRRILMKPKLERRFVGRSLDNND